MRNTSHSNTEDLLTSIEVNLMNEQPEVQWVMKYNAGQIGKWQDKYRVRCIAIVKENTLYKVELVPR